MALTHKQAEHLAIVYERKQDWRVAEEYWLRACDTTADAPTFLVERYRARSVECATKARLAQRVA